MFDRGARLGVLVALVVLVAGGCAPSTVTRPPASMDTEGRQPAPEAPSNFASPQDLFQRYPTMRRQEL